MNDAFVIAAVGDSAVILRFEERIDPELNTRVRRVAAAMRNAGLAGFRDVVPSFNTVTLHFDPLRTNVDEMLDRLRVEAVRGTSDESPDITATVEIPVCYGGEFGLDLAEVASWSGLTESEVVSIHQRGQYRVYMLGFVPGFAYLGTLDARIAMPRRSSVRVAVPAGSVGVAGPQTAVYPVQTPGGWNLIGRTPLRMFDAARNTPSVLAPGDRVVFRSIDRGEFDQLARQQEHDA